MFQVMLVFSCLFSVFIARFIAVNSDRMIMMLDNVRVKYEEVVLF